MNFQLNIIQVILRLYIWFLVKNISPTTIAWFWGRDSKESLAPETIVWSIFLYTDYTYVKIMQYYLSNFLNQIPNIKSKFQFAKT